MKNLLYIVALLFSYDLFAQSAVNPWHDVPKISKKSLDTLLNHSPKSFEYEVTDIYDSISNIPDDDTERLFIVQLLKEKGFQITNWGRGNWMMGPRIISIDMQKDKYNCQVSKLYYSNDTGYEDKTLYKVTEGVKCHRQ